MAKNNALQSEVIEEVVVVNPEVVETPSEYSEASDTTIPGADTTEKNSESEASDDTPENNVEDVAIKIEGSLKAGILILGRDYKKGTSSEMTLDLLRQVVKGRLKAKRDGAAEKEGQNYDRMAKSLPATMVKLLPSRAAYINQELQALDDCIMYLGR